jgi:hypothetical protein
VSVKNAIKKSQDQINNTLSKVHRATPNEVVDEKRDTLKQYNKTRKEHISRLTRKALQVGDHVRIQIKSDKDVKIGYKSYKGLTFSNQVYTIDRRTKKLPHKYYIKPKRKWFLADKLLKSAPRDKKSQKIIEDRDEEQKSDDREEEEKQKVERKKQEAAQSVRDALRKARRTGSRKDVAEKLRAKIKARQQSDEDFEKLLDADQKEYEKEQRGKGKQIRKKKREVLKYFKQKWGRDDDDEWVPEEPKKVKKRKPKKKKPPVIDLTKQKKIPMVDLT